MRVLVRALVPAIAGWMLAACASEPAPESACYGSDECGATTPVCSYGGTCTRSCTTSADCSDLALQTPCDRWAGNCAEPCTEDAIGSYACVDGERVYCGEDTTLSCAICPDVCGAGSFCDGSACQPRRATGEACRQSFECSSGACTGAGRCSAAQGEACTAETCAGVCAERASGATHCILSSCPSDCAERTDGGLEWYCARYDSYQACVPLERCIWQGGCSTFLDSTCGQSCRSGYGCWTYCVPDVISTDD